MAYSENNKFVLSNLCLFPENGIELFDQLSDCYRQFTEVSRSKSEGVTALKITVFISSDSNVDYFDSKKKMVAGVRNLFGTLPLITIVPQSPENGSLALEVMYIDGLQPEEVIPQQNDKVSWLVVKRGSLKVVITEGLSEDSDDQDILAKSEFAFKKLKSILLAEEMTFSDIVRQWNYIEGITSNEAHEHGMSQHYQIFNDVRSKYYCQSKFVNGFPSATGIGIECGGIIIDAIAVADDRQHGIIPIKSPVQLDAHQYTTDVLADNNAMCDFCRTTPKFERAKVLTTGSSKWVFISGTAAIMGQNSISEPSVEIQTETTIQNILSLISPDNIKKHGVIGDNEACIQHLRVYVKYADDMQKVKNICYAYFPNFPIIYVIADVCRPELLVEIEGLAIVG